LFLLNRFFHDDVPEDEVIAPIEFDWYGEVGDDVVQESSECADVGVSVAARLNISRVSNPFTHQAVKPR
jgi:hypothetical protein